MVFWKQLEVEDKESHEIEKIPMMRFYYVFNLAQVDGLKDVPAAEAGRMDGQSVVLWAEKGKLKLSVSDQQNNEQELTYDLNQNNDRKEGTEKMHTSAPSQCPGQSPGGAVGVDGTVQAGGSLPPVSGH